MTTFPIHVPRNAYRGANVAKRRRAFEYDADAIRLERYLNAQIEADPRPIQQFIYGFVAPRIGMSEARVREILFQVDCGHNGLTVAKRQQDWRAFIDSLPCSTDR